MTKDEFRQSLVQTLIEGAAAHIAHEPERAPAIAKGLKTVLDELAPAAQQPVATAVTDEMVGRFLGWKLPADFSPDCGISFKRESDYDHPEFGRTKFEPIGTNLLTAAQARAMLEQVLGVAHPGSGAPSVVDTGPDSLEREIQAKAGKAPRVKPADVKAEIVGETFTLLPSGRVTVCELTLKNGFTVRGESAVVFVENFDAEIGRKVARENAEKEVWQLLGFRLRDQLANT